MKHKFTAGRSLSAKASRLLAKGSRLLAALAALAALAPATSVVAQEGPKLEWEVVNPFRFIRKQGIVEELRDAYAALEPEAGGRKTAYGLERALQKLADDEVDRRRAAVGNCDNPQTKDERRRCFEPYLGWFERLARNNHDATCWDSKAQGFRKDDDCKDYIKPRIHRVRVWVTNPHLLGGRTPQWLVDGGPPDGAGACDARHRKEVCVEFDVKYDPDELRESQVSVNFSGGGVAVEAIPVKVRDRLIVGLGDSYASGEGNPDIPASFTEGKTDPDFLFDLNWRRTPRKDEGSEVGWLDRRCHRSMYSYQFKAALQLALEEPRRAVTYVTYSCSGATTDHIINKRKKPIEGGSWVVPQRDALKAVLEGGEGEPRKVDYLLLSTGGNDIGFSKFVAYIVTSGAALRIVGRGLNEESIKKKGSKIKEVLFEDKDKGNYSRLHSELLGPDGVRFRRCEVEKTCDAILLTTYPDILLDEKERECQADRGEFDIPFGKDSKRGKRLKRVRDFIFTPLRAVQKDPGIRSALGWTVVDGHYDFYLRQGFCAQNPRRKSEPGEQFVMPSRRDGEWEPFKPWMYKAYESRQRWIRLPVDAKLTTDQVHIILNRIVLDFLAEDDRSNIMHPTAEGLARTADANVKEILDLEARRP